MGLIYMEQIRGYPYMRKKQLMEEFQVSRAFVDKKYGGLKMKFSPDGITDIPYLMVQLMYTLLFTTGNMKNSCQTAMQENMCRR